MSGSNSMYGRNADLAAEREAILGLPAEQQQAALLAMSQRRSGVPEAPGGFREPTAASEGGAYTQGLPPATGRFATSINVPPPSVSAKDAEPAATGGASSSSNPLSGLPAGMQSILSQQRDLYRRQGEVEEGVAGVQQRQRQRVAKGERDASRAYADTQRQLTQDLDRRLRPIPEFVPTQETARDIGMLGSLLMLAGATLGGKGQRGALMAVQSMTGMMAGYRQGRQDLYQRERQNFETGVRQVQAQNQQLQEAFSRAQRLAQTDMEAAQRQFQVDAVALGANLPRLAGQRAGLQGELQVLQSTAQMVSQIEQRKAAAEQAAAVRRQALDEAQAREQRTRDATIASQRRDIQGQENYLVEQGLPREAVRGIGPREVAAVSSRIEAAELTYRLAEAVRNNPQAAGLAGQIINRIDRFDPGRYGNDVQGGFFNSLLNSLVERQPLQGTPDQIAQARSIAKLAVDVINARALAASGGGRMLVTEFNAQKGVISLEGQSPQSAVSVYNNLANDDIRGISRYGLGQYVPGLQTRAQEHARDYVARVFPSVTGSNTTTTPPIGNVQRRQGETARARANEPVRITDDDAGRAALADLPPGTEVILPNGVRTRTLERPTPQ